MARYPATARHPLPSSGSIPHELQSAVEMRNAVLRRPPQRRADSPLSEECSNAGLVWLSGLPCQDFQTIPTSIPPATMKNSRHLHSAAAALPAKSS